MFSSRIILINYIFWEHPSGIWKLGSIPFDDWKISFHFCYSTACEHIFIYSFYPSLDLNLLLQRYYLQMLKIFLSSIAFSRLAFFRDVPLTKETSSKLLIKTRLEPHSATQYLLFTCIWFSFALLPSTAHALRQEILIVKEVWLGFENENHCQQEQTSYVLNKLDLFWNV